MMRRKRRITAVFLSVMMVVLTACGNGSGDVQESMAPVEEETEKIEEETVVEDKAEVETEEVEPEEEEGTEEVDTEETEEKVLIPYFIENELEFDNELSVETQAVRTNINDETDMEVADAVWTLKSITIEDGEEEGTQVITIQSECKSYYWTDRKNRQMYSIVLPLVRGFDTYTGRTFPNLNKTGDMALGYVLDDLESNEVTYKIDYNGSSEWDDSGDWTYDEKSGGYIHPTTVHYEDTFVIEPQGYDSLGIVIVPLAISDMEDREDGVHENDELIKDVLERKEGCYLYSVMDMYAMLNEDSGDGDEDNTSTNTETQKDSTTTNNSSTTPKQNTSTNSGGSKENTTPKQEQPTHTHSYTSSVTKNPTCTEEGVRTYICTCGDSYTEPIAKTGHQWTTSTQTISHPSTGHYETVTKKELWCYCGARFQSQADLTAHQETCENGNTCGVDEWTENVWVVDAEAWDETITVTTCSVCGATQ